MITWSTSVEIFCLIILFIIIINFYEKRLSSTLQNRLYQVCLWMSAGSILLNIICVYTIHNSTRFATWVNVFLNSCYFGLLVTMSTVMAYYLTQLVLEHVYTKTCLHRARRLFCILYGLFMGTLICNLFNGCIFYFDEQKLYHRGPLINAGYGVMLAELFAVVFCTIRNFPSVSQPVRHVMRTMPPVIVLLTIYQISYPNELLNGAIIVSVNLILLLNFQSRRTEQDSLTCIGNRTSFYQELSLRLAGRQAFELIVLSLDQFGLVNQRYGHTNGDLLLCDMARWLDHIHPLGRAFRFGNVHFSLLIPSQDEITVQQLLYRIRSRLDASWKVQDVHIRLETRLITLSHREEDWTATDVLEFLKYGLTLSKEKELPFIRYDQKLFDMVQQQKKTIDLMHRALHENFFQVWYQPIYHCKCRTFRSAEALLRLQDESGAMVSPELFISLAEKHGMIDQLTWVVMEQVCQLLGSPHAPQLEYITINLSMQQFLSEDLISHITDCLERYRLSPSQLHIEVTEHTLAADFHHMQTVMQQLYDLGIHFYLDDFGTGYSNLSNVLTLPFSCIKIDRSLIDDYPRGQSSTAIVNTMLTLFHSMGYEVVAEGVETEQQALALIQQGADKIQGFYYARPMPPAALQSFLQCGAGLHGTNPAHRAINT